MRAMVLRRIASLAETESPLEMADWPEPEPVAGEIRLRVAACGVCHTELDEIEGRTAPPRLPVILGHEVVGTIDRLGDGVTKLRAGDRVGVGWIHSSNGETDENLSPAFVATGRDVNGGYAEYMTANADYAYPIPDRYSDVEAAPLLCAGAVGYRALKLTNLKDGDRLGLMGFGGSAHLVLQLARHRFPNSPTYVFARDQEAREFARQLGAVWAGHATERAPAPLDAIVDTTPAWRPLVDALANLRPGGRLVINAIRKDDADKNALLELSYHDHLWMEREIKTVANVTHFDLQEFLPLAAAAPIHCEVTTYRLEDANQALRSLKCEPVRGAKVLVVG